MKNKELEDRGDRIEKALNELAKEDEKVAKALKSAGASLDNHLKFSRNFHNFL